MLRSSNDTTAVSPTTPANEDFLKRAVIRKKRMVEQVILMIWLVMMVMLLRIMLL